MNACFYYFNISSLYVTLYLINFYVRSVNLKHISAKGSWDAECFRSAISISSSNHSQCLQNNILNIQFSSVQFSGSVISNSLRPHESQHARPPCPSPTPGVYSNSCPSSRWWHLAISSSVVPFSSCPQSLPASGSFPMSQLFAWGSQSIGVSASKSDLL